MSPGRLPWLTLGVSALAVAVFATGGAGALELSAAALARGELFRLATGHLTHWSLGHLAWDVVTFAALGAQCERRGRRDLARVLLLSGLAIPLTVLVLRPELPAYRGLSGLDVALFALLAGQLGGRQGIGLGALLAAKLGWELAAGSALFVTADPVGVVLVPEAHLAGALSAGLYIGCCRWIIGGGCGRIAARHE